MQAKSSTHKKADKQPVTQDMMEAVQQQQKERRQQLNVETDSVQHDVQRQQPKDL